MPLQNRVSPDGELVAVSARGAWMGNRGGALHDAERRIVRTHRSAAWITCRLEFADRHREVMRPGRYTELFFLDEATALAAGHRPCFECRRDAALAFASALEAGLGLSTTPRAREIDALLHPTRLPTGAGRPTWVSPSGALPDGAMVSRDGQPWVVIRNALRQWSFDGYGRSEPMPAGPLDVLTPEPTVVALRAGYRAQLHNSFCG